MRHGNALRLIPWAELGTTTARVIVVWSVAFVALSLGWVAMGIVGIQPQLPHWVFSVLVLVLFPTGACASLLANRYTATIPWAKRMAVAVSAVPKPIARILWGAIALIGALLVVLDPTGAFASRDDPTLVMLAESVIYLVVVLMIVGGVRVRGTRSQSRTPR